MKTTENKTERDSAERRASRKPIDGFVLVDKPRGITSFDAIRELRRILGFRKMGHMGTLDPNATGLLPICTGRATRLSRFLLSSDKTYVAKIRLGRQTTTYDADGEFVGETLEPPVLDDDQLHAHLSAFIGEISQQPPIYSAKKVDGKRLYEYARAGEEIERKACRVTIYEINVLERDRETLRIAVSSSSGMYVRSLAHDLGQQIGCGAYLEELTRTRVGGLNLEQAYSLDDIAAMSEKDEFRFLRPMDELLPGMPKLVLNQAQAARVRNGNHIVVNNPLLSDGEHVRLADETGLIAVGRVRKPFGSAQLQVLPKVVFN